ncbi:hypothetical protein V2W30_30120 [Streptomyces sp. Q6]|uniref:Uncharacterized protein n=1 Tax=Streptomyces citrinus TaxID=3118173 RepID=A0ACD5AIW3_9ACTN
MIGLASIAGQVVGGLSFGLVLFGLGWRWIFLAISVPVFALFVRGSRAWPAGAGSARE